MDVRLVTLPHPPGVRKVDLADFLKNHPAEDFQRLCDEAPAYLDARLATYPVSGEGYVNCQTARQFATDVLGQCPDAQKALAFLRHRVRAYFHLRVVDIDDILKVSAPLWGQTIPHAPQTTGHTAPLAADPSALA